MKRTFSLIINLWLFIALSCHEKISTRETSPPGNLNYHDIIADLERTLSNDLVIKQNGSISAAVFIKDEIIWSKAFGKADIQKGINADSSTVYRIGSISKTITAYLMLLMVQKGLIHLDDPVAKYVPEIKSIKQNGIDISGQITLRQLADHTSGLAREPDLPYADSGPTENWEDKVLNSIPTTTLHPPVGKTFSYSNIGYAILGLAISRAAHKPFTDLVDQLVFRPHGMKNSFYIIPKRDKNQIAMGYTWNPVSSTYESGQSVSQFSGRGYKVPNGGVFTTANDLARFIMSLMSNTDSLAKNYRDSMQTIQVFQSDDSGYGLGLNILNKQNGVKQVFHGGLVPGFTSYMVFNPESRTGIVLLANCDDFDCPIEFQANSLLNILVEASKQARGNN